MLKRLKKLQQNTAYPTWFSKRPVLWIALVGVFIVSFFAQPLYKFFTTVPEPLPAAIQVQTVRVKVVSMPESVETIGNITAKTEVKIKAVVNGKIQTFMESGSWVKAGTVLGNMVGIGPEIRAPFDGYLTDWQVKSGEFITAGTELVDLVDTELLTLIYRVPEHYASKLDMEQPVEVSVKAYENLVFQGKVKFISPIVDRKTHTILIKAMVKNPDQNLWPGMSAHVKQILALHPQALVIPESCVILTLEGYEVFVIVDGKIQKRKVIIGERSKGRVHVLSGLTLEEPVVIVRTNVVSEGASAVANDWAGDW
ncbi:MAG TPA: efflux RND transporter periplasmic adaptor subunit [Gammaproteobacteria bacterium]|nr:efflux RND transporter periplasmic adaptor subunit [Gammaproteobacteria bacterium]